MTSIFTAEDPGDRGAAGAADVLGGVAEDARALEGVDGVAADGVVGLVDDDQGAAALGGDDVHGPVEQARDRLAAADAAFQAFRP
ncbi:hypothetical protein [Streptomyces longispororuber]|uniref:hypothetical protein n=1 Tax=Streptomyces longispororuber TaxID=68230 RepID=UPI00167D77CB|nr:hypothetical protein [Streptomyces longispororuber]